MFCTNSPEARKPELQLAADELKDELDALLDEAALDEEQEKNFSRHSVNSIT